MGEVHEAEGVNKGRKDKSSIQFPYIKLRILHLKLQDNSCLLTMPNYETLLTIFHLSSRADSHGLDIATSRYVIVERRIQGD